MLPSSILRTTTPYLRRRSTLQPLILLHHHPTPTTTTHTTTAAAALSTTSVGKPIPGLDYLKDASEAPILRPSVEYPAWVGELASRPLPTLARLERMREEDATDAEKMRYLKLTRRGEIKAKNSTSAK